MDTGEIYRLYKLIEDKYNFDVEISPNSEIDNRSRSTIVQWIINLHWGFDLSDETLYLAILLLDRYISIVPVSKEEFQPLSSVCIILASKFEDVNYITIEDLSKITGITSRELYLEEIKVLKTLSYKLVIPTVFYFIDCLSRKFNVSSTKCLHYARIALFPRVLAYLKPSLLATVCVYTANQSLLSELVSFTGYDEYDIVSNYCRIKIYEKDIQNLN